ncbi:unnamed protein product [Paramecium octaurelia]|uniref:4-hydroxybenzoate polyprenyltransferase, mitochondrial n=1 Tax=Paramecium octaurelia TaxID=43137 RepID=A0A8S1VYQ4_PAROT|nr:unnamed protein product [Paramecium octaurelia]
MIKYLSAHLRLARHDKPIGALLLHIPCVWGTILGQPTFNFQEIIWYSSVFGVGSFTMRAAGCVVNDMWDKNIDNKVERTRQRPLASGELQMKDAWISLFAHCSVGLLVLTQLNWSTIAASFGIVPIAFLYPLAKRYFSYPQLVLGIAFNWGVVVGGLQLAGMLNPTIMLGYTAGIVNTLIYDTVYGHQDKEYDKSLGLYSTAYTLPKNTPLYLTWVFSGLIGLTCYAASYHPGVYPLIALNQLDMYLRLKATDFDNPESCGKFFRDFKWFQVTIALIFGAGSYMKQ